MNNWQKTQTSRVSSLRESAVNSSAASLRTPLPVIIQNQRNDEVFSNKSKSVSVDMGSQEEFAEQDGGYQYQYQYQHQHTNSGYHLYQNESRKQMYGDAQRGYLNGNYGNMMRKSMGLFNSNIKDNSNINGNNIHNASYSYRNSMGDRKFHQSNILQDTHAGKNVNQQQINRSRHSQVIRNPDKNIIQKKNRLDLIRQTTNIPGNHKAQNGSKNKNYSASNSNLREIYSSQSSSSRNMRQYNKQKPARNAINSKQRYKQKYSTPSSGNIINNQQLQKIRHNNTYIQIKNNGVNNRQLNMSYITNINSKKNRSSENATPVVTKPALIDPYVNARNRYRNKSTNSQSNSQSNSNSDEIFVNKNRNQERNNKIQPSQKYFQKQQRYEYESDQQYQDQDKNQNENYQNIDDKYKNITYDRYRNIRSKEKKNQSNVEVQRQEKIQKKTKQKVQIKNQFTNSKKWINSVRSFASLNFDSSSNSHRNSSSNFKAYLNQNLNNSRASQSNSIYGSVVRDNQNEKDKKVSHYSRHQSHQSSRHSYTNSKRLLTTNRQSLDRRQYIVCIIEYCSNQVGIACYNIKTGQICLTQIIQRMTYLRTVSTLQRFYPQQIIFSSTLENTLLMRKLMNHFKRTSFKPIKRALFDQTKGYYIYTQRGNKNQNNPDHKFLAYAALNALLVTMESTFQFTVTYSALNIKWHYLQEVLVIDSQTVADLQIFINKETKVIKNTFIDNFKCLTDGGMRMLRANILQPLTDVGAINQRIQLVEFFLCPQNKAIIDLLIRELIKFKNYETVTAKFIQTPRCQNIRSIKSYLYGILMLSRMCFQLRNLQKKVGSIIQNIKTSNTQSHKNTQVSSILTNLYIKLSDPRVEDIRKIIQQNFDEQILKNYQNLANNQINTVALNNRRNKNKQVRSNSNNISAGINRNVNKKDNFIFVFKLEKIEDQFAQISRLTYSHTIQDILKTFEQIKQKIKAEHNTKLLYNQHRGYYISCRYSCPSGQLDLPTLSNTIQDDIIHITTKNNTITFTSSILISLNNRLKQNESKLIYQSMELLLVVIREIQKKMEVLFQINYWVSVVDMVIGFVGFVKGYQGEFKVGFCRPKFIINHKDNQKQPILKIQKLRTIWTMQKYQKLSSDISIELAPGTYSLVIQKQLNSFDQLNILYSIGFMTILAQIGCLVPAEQFSTSIYEVLISKMEVQGNLENKMSHFQMQLVSLRNILDNVTERDQIQPKKQKNKNSDGRILVLMDEICKGTKPSEQYALSIAAIEQLLFNKPQQNNVSVILVSDYVLFNMLGNFDRLSLCQFSVLEEQNQDLNGQLTNQQRNLMVKQKLLVQCIQKYNFDQSFLEIYGQLPKIMIQ